MARGQIEFRTADEIALMREAGRVVFEILDQLEAAACPGVSTLELDKLAEELTRKKGAKPAFKGYLGYPACVCISLNEEVVHGIPSKKRKLVEGDLLKLDFGVSYRGLFADAARTLPVGKVTGEALALITVTKGSLAKAIEAARVDGRVGDLGHAVQSFVEEHGFSVVRDFVGHGIGRQLHEQPQVPNFGQPNTGPRLQAGMAIAIEPMVNAGTHKVELLDDGWTAVTLDGKLSAHFEHTVLLTEQGPQILTAPN